jgi:hypothetical protein
MKKALPILEIHKKNLKKMIETREQQNAAYA